MAIVDEVSVVCTTITSKLATIYTATDNNESMIDTNETLISQHSTYIYDIIAAGSGVTKDRITQDTMDNAAPPVALGLCLTGGSGEENVWIYMVDSSDNLLWQTYSNSDGSYELFVVPGLGSISIHYTKYGFSKPSRTVTV